MGLKYMKSRVAISSTKLCFQVCMRFLSSFQDFGVGFHFYETVILTVIYLFQAHPTRTVQI